MGRFMENIDTAAISGARRFFERPIANTACAAAGAMVLHMVSRALDRRDSARRHQELAEAYQERAALLQEQGTLLNAQYEGDLL